MFEDSKTQLFMGTITNGYADTNAWTAAGQPTGSVVFVKVIDNTVEEGALVAGTEYRVIGKNTLGVLQYSPVFTPATLKNAFAVENEARVEQVSYLGYNGTSGSLDAVNSTYYSLRVVLDSTFGMLNNSPLMLTIPYKSDASATQREVAANLAIAGTAIFNRQAFKPIMVERINSGAQADAIHDHTLDVTNGSKTVTFSDDSDAFVTAGTILRIGGTGAGATPCYLVASRTSATVFELDQPYQGATATVAHGNVESVTEGNWGLMFHGISVTDANFNPVTDEPFVVSFTLQPSENFTTAVVTNSVVPVIGSGTYQQVSALEAYCQGQHKDHVISAYPPTVRLFQAVVGESYHIYSFEIWDEKYVSVTTGVRPISPTRIVIALDKDLDDAFATVLGVTLTAGLI